ncbi:hypothetical protein TWF102_004822 [Orbilia oligospora]|uniref:Uncharacterized protein n=1 Tax=Orbilia oligospora TaxID=2813651 RepID=A0A7C8NMK4_ORBOL|nr:hypothetical protein TWF103_010660 [Orbilia oligospora]KAF3101576.1 hypothetical protein TWF102_004822 [Orbilia oligospora]KAF3108242.1 hypothetical protein TWF706_002138 [Orbilia oligospora]KAF3118436.1 hypothetical protein TWF703_005953 [Orbilia oligospora]KAF3128986.1 hypothetical protein TWF594_011160 [Orbilia oligospora]
MFSGHDIKYAREMTSSHPSFKVWQKNADGIRSTLGKYGVEFSFIYARIINDEQIPGVIIHLKKGGTGQSSANLSNLTAELRRGLVPDDAFPILDIQDIILLPLILDATLLHLSMNHMAWDTVFEQESKRSQFYQDQIASTGFKNL